MDQIYESVLKTLDLFRKCDLLCSIRETVYEMNNQHSIAWLDRSGLVIAGDLSNIVNGVIIRYLEGFVFRLDIDTRGCKITTTTTRTFSRTTGKSGSCIREISNEPEQLSNEAFWVYQLKLSTHPIHSGNTLRLIGRKDSLSSISHFRTPNPSSSISMRVNFLFCPTPRPQKTSKCST